MYAHLLLQSLDLLGKGRLRDAQTFGGTMDMFFRCDRREISKMS